MDELLKALTPYPMVQGIAFGLIIAAIGAWAVRRGLQDSRKNENSVEEIKSQWELHKAIGNIHENSFAMVKCMEKQNDLAEQLIAAINRIADGRWNNKQ